MNMHKPKTALSAVRICTLLLAAACGGGSAAGGSGAGSGVAKSEGGGVLKSGSGQAINVEAHNRWKDGVNAFKAAEKQGWNDARCDSVAEKFESAAEAQAKFAEALYMAGVAHSKCGRKEKAAALYQKALRQNGKFCKARVAVALDRMTSGGGEPAALSDFQAAVRDDPQCTEGYVNVAIIQRKRGETKEALNNLRRALAIDAQYLPAFNEMALLYVQDAKDNAKMLDLAEVVCSQAQKIDAKYAAIYNTWGLIDLRRGEIIGAAAKFQKAFELDSKMFEAYMNFAQITIGFRGYEDARNAFTKALELQPKSFDATVGLGVAYRGLEQPAKAEEYYEKAKQMNGNRPEPFYNLGVLYQDFKEGNADQMKKARSYYEQFLSRAGTDARYAGAVEEVKRRCKTVKGQRRPNDKCISGRFQNIEDYLQALKDMDEMERLNKEAAKQQAELEAEQKAEEAKAAAEAQKNPPPAEPPPAAEPPPEGAPPAGDKKAPAGKEGGKAAPKEDGAKPEAAKPEGGKAKKK
jgi:tetratricopeptide (TPR) repeat protein